MRGACIIKLELPGYMQLRTVVKQHFVSLHNDVLGIVWLYILFSDKLTVSSYFL